MLVLIIAVALPFSVRAGFFSELFTQEIVVEVVAADVSEQSPVDVPLLSAEQNPNPLNGRGGADIVVNDNALVSTGPVGEDEISEVSSSNGEIRVYTVRQGDSLSEVAEMFGVTTNTIRWANDLSGTTVQPGETLVILPIAGVRHVIKDGDSLSKIAAKYEGDEEEILAFNQLSSESELIAGETLIIPGGAMREASPASTRSLAGGSVSVAAGGSGSFIHPAPGSVKTQGLHGYNAVDLAGGYGSAIRAAAAGEVIVARASGWNGGYGAYTVIRHSNGTQTLYAHLSSFERRGRKLCRTRSTNWWYG